MVETFDLLLRGGTLVTHNGIGLGDLATAAAGEVMEAQGLHILLGVINT
jgi:dihydroorotase